MPLENDIYITDNIEVNFVKPNQKKNFVVTLANRDFRSKLLKNINISHNFIKVINFNINNAKIPGDGQKSFIFEAEYVPKTNNDIKDCKIRFTFTNRTSVTRRVKIVYDEKTEKNSMFDNKLEKMNSFQKHVAIEISGNMNIKFDQSQQCQFFSLFIRNNTNKNISLISVCTGKSVLKLRNDNIEKCIPPSSELELFFEALYVPDKMFDCVPIHFKFDRTTFLRTIKLIYVVRGPNIVWSKYDTPDELVDLILSECKIPHAKLLSSLDEWIPSVETNYAMHFHNLYYLEEIGMRKVIKDLYSQNEAYFNDTEKIYEDGKIVKKKYGEGIYDIEVVDLFESRPSLQIGKKIILYEYLNK